jgi:precorrin-6Y C5,15-methyltransferase (decarboxylating)
MRNAAACGVPHLQLVEGPAPAAFDALAAPNAIFVGGGATTPGLIDAARAALRSGGRLVVNAVTLETESALLTYQSQCGGSLTRIEISRAAPLGSEPARMTGWRPARPIVQWTWVKP